MAAMCITIVIGIVRDISDMLAFLTGMVADVMCMKVRFMLQVHARIGVGADCQQRI